MSLPYYPMYPRDFFEGTQEMSLELKGAYIMVLNLMYTRGGPSAMSLASSRAMSAALSASGNRSATNWSRWGNSTFKTG